MVTPRCLATLAVVCLLTAGRPVPAVAEAVPRPCCLPAVWEGRTSSMTGQVVNGHVVSYMNDGSIHVDTKNQRFASYQTVETQGRQVNVTVIELVGEEVMYVIVPAIKSCLKQPAAAINNCIPDNAHYLGAQRVGGATSGSLHVDAWGVHVTTGMDVFARALVARRTCAPVFQSTFGNVGNTQVMRADNFHDVRETIADPGVFEVPAYCQNSPMVVMDNNVLSLISHHRTRRAVLV